MHDIDFNVDCLNGRIEKRHLEWSGLMESRFPSVRKGQRLLGEQCSVQQ